MFTLPYILKSSVILTVLLVYYGLFLKKRTFFQLNRFYLLSILLLTVTLPLLRISVSFIAPTAVKNIVSIQSLTYWLDEVTISPGEAGDSSPVFFHPSYLQFAYWTGVGIFSSLTFFSFFHLKKIARSFPHKTYKKLHFVRTSGTSPTFSFFNYLFFNDYGLTRDNKHKVYEHEKVHIREFHSIDLLLAQLVCILNWYNPLVWYTKRLISENHEYIADQYAIQKFLPESYLQLLIHQTFKKNIPLIHCFSCSNLKKRIFMITKPKSTSHSRFTYLPALLLAGLFFILFTCDFSDKLLSSSRTDRTDSEKEEEVFVVAEIMPVFKENLLRWMSSHIQYPSEAQKKKIEGQVYVQFIIDKNGKVKKPEILRHAHPLLDAEALRLIRTMPDWEPGRQRGESVNVSYNLPITFKLQEEEIFQIVETMPVFKEGNVLQWIRKNLHYPQEAVDTRKEGKVHIKFIVEKDGRITHPQILRSSNTLSLDQEALRVIRAMPAWQPGRQANENVRVSYNLPITFTLKK